MLAGTTTPNCIRTTCYDANSLEYNVVILEDCCSSQTEEIQRANIADMERMGAVIMNSKDFYNYSENTVADMSRRIFEEIQET
ncbi:cysteine hydrolase family protein [Treponema sp.]|uniref:cysteine hydrolase family protein n=1 Tax=Treponema sp. TaxID=166 RepID=UPI003F11F7E1